MCVFRLFLRFEGLVENLLDDIFRGIGFLGEGSVFDSSNQLDVVNVFVDKGVFYFNQRSYEFSSFFFFKVFLLQQNDVLL